MAILFLNISESGNQLKALTASLRRSGPIGDTSVDKIQCKVEAKRPEQLLFLASAREYYRARGPREELMMNFMLSYENS